MATSVVSVALAAIYNGTPQRDANLFKGESYVIQGTLEKVAGTTSGDYMGLIEVHKDWSISNILIASDALTGFTSMSVGLTTVDQSTTPPTFTNPNTCDACYTSAVDVAAGVAAFTERAWSARDIAKSGQYVWQDAGYASRDLCPERLILAIKVGSATTATGTISWRVHVITG